MSQAAALRLPRAAACPRRRRRRPPTQRELEAMWHCGLTAFVWIVLIPVLTFALHFGPIVVWPVSGAGGIMFEVCKKREWPIVKNYIKNGWMDD